MKNILSKFALKVLEKMYKKEIIEIKKKNELDWNSVDWDEYNKLLKKDSAEKTLANENVLNKFKGEKIDFYDFTATLDEFKGKSITVELLKGVNTVHNYKNFDWSTYNDILSFDDYDMEKPSISFSIKDIIEIIEGTGMYNNHYLIKLNNEMEIMLLEE